MTGSDKAGAIESQRENIPKHIHWIPLTVKRYLSNRYDFLGINSMAEKRSNPDQFQLRLPPGMRQAIKLVAEANNRSLNAEIVSQLASGGIREALVQQKEVLELSVDIDKMASEILTQMIAEMKGQQAITRAALPVLKDIRDLQGDPNREDLERIGDKIEELIKAIVKVTGPTEQAAKTLVDRLHDFSHDLASRVRS